MNIPSKSTRKQALTGSCGPGNGTLTSPATEQEARTIPRRGLLLAGVYYGQVPW